MELFLRWTSRMQLRLWTILLILSLLVPAVTVRETGLLLLKMLKMLITLLMSRMYPMSPSPRSFILFKLFLMPKLLLRR